MGHTPFGYRIVNGSPVIVESEAECIRMIFRNYLDGMGLAGAGKCAGYPAVKQCGFISECHREKSLRSSVCI